MNDFQQLSVFDIGRKKFKIDKPVRLIELFAGIGSQAKALERLGADFEHYRVCEFDKYAISSYNAIHGTDFATSDITQLTADDLGIVDTDKYCYLLTYSFPCQDLSLAGKQKGMAKGENTRSGLLWEVERLINECEELPQVLLMENVTQVHGKKNKEHFDEWIKFLEGKGYSNYWQDLNAKNFGIPQNRNRTFMVSILGDYTYEFPKEFPLKLRLKDMLEDSVEEKFYISDKGIEYITKRNGKYTQICDETTEIAKSAITAVGNQNWTGNYIKEPKCQQVGMLSGGKWDKLHDISRRVYSGDGVAPTIHTSGGGQQEPKVVEPTINKIDVPQTVRVRKYTVDCKSLCKLLRERKQSLQLSTQDIADRLKNVPLTTVEHWFRQDNSFAIPDENIWFKLKSLLCIETNEFDEAITVFEEKEGVFEKSNRCYFFDGIAPTLTSASADEKIIEPRVIGGIGEKKSNGGTQWYPQDRIYDNEIAMSVTTGFLPYYKTEEPTINVVGNHSPSGHDASRIVDTKGLAPTVKENHGTVTAITEPVPFDYRYDEGVRVRQDGCMPTLNATHTGTTSMSGQGFIAEPLAYDEQNGYIRKDGTVGTLTTDGSSPKHNNRVIEDLRIRKLTPRECYRLMGFDDADFDKAAQHNSNSQLYKQAGNSIVVDVLAHIFTQML